MAPVEKAKAVLAKLRETDPTGGLRIADCKHGFRDLMLVQAIKKDWHLVLSANIKCWKCEEPGGNVISQKIDYCPMCGEALNGAPVRNYILGQNEAVDLHMLGIGAFAGIEMT